MSVPESLNWMKNDLFNEDLSTKSGSKLSNDWYCSFFEDEELADEFKIVDNVRCEIYEEFMRSFFLDEKATRMYEYLFLIDHYKLNIMDEEQWGFYHSYMLIDSNINHWLSEVRGNHSNTLGLKVQVTDSYFVSEKRYAMKEVEEAKRFLSLIKKRYPNSRPKLEPTQTIHGIECHIVSHEVRTFSFSIYANSRFVIEAEIDGIKKKFTGSLMEIGFCQWRKENYCPYCGDDTHLGIERPDNFSEWLNKRLEYQYFQD